MISAQCNSQSTRFASANHWTAAWRPKLVVSYTLPGQEQGGSGRGAGHASLALQPAPEATPPANHTWRSYYHAAGRRVATPAIAPQVQVCGCRMA